MRMSVAQLLREIEKEELQEKKDKKHRDDKITNRRAQALAWCKKQGVGEEQIQSAWDNALKQGNLVAKNFVSWGGSWRDLEPKILQQLFDRYLPLGHQSTESA